MNVNELMESPWLVIDVESCGLHGAPFAVGAVLMVRGLWDHLYMKCWATKVPDDGWLSEEDLAWVKANVKVKPNCEHIVEVYENFLNWWHMLQLKYPGIRMAADCAWPVEARFLLEVANHARKSGRKFEVYPLVDISSVMLMVGLDPLASYPRAEYNLPAHHPLNDAKHSAGIFYDCMRRLGGMGEVKGGGGGVVSDCLARKIAEAHFGLDKAQRLLNRLVALGDCKVPTTLEAREKEVEVAVGGDVVQVDPSVDMGALRAMVRQVQEHHRKQLVELSAEAVAQVMGGAK